MYYFAHNCIISTLFPKVHPSIHSSFFYYRATETQVTKVEDSTEKTDESAIPDDIKAFYQKIDDDDDDEEESKGLILKLFNQYFGGIERFYFKTF